jgi:hypothetical protein
MGWFELITIFLDHDALIIYWSCNYRSALWNVWRAMQAIQGGPGKDHGVWRKKASVGQDP